MCGRVEDASRLLLRCLFQPNDHDPSDCLEESICQDVQGLGLLQKLAVRVRSKSEHSRRTVPPVVVGCYKYRAHLEEEWTFSNRYIIHHQYSSKLAKPQLIDLSEIEASRSQEPKLSTCQTISP